MDLCYNIIDFTTGPLRGGHDADVARSENEFDAPALRERERDKGEGVLRRLGSNPPETTSTKS